MTTCTATTAVDHPCKNHTMPGSQFCKVHGGRTLTPGDVIAHGAPLANTNALKHGFYLSVIREDEYADLLKYAEQLDIADELALSSLRTYSTPCSASSSFI